MSLQQLCCKQTTIIPQCAQTPCRSQTGSASVAGSTKLTHCPINSDRSADDIPGLLGFISSPYCASDHFAQTPHPSITSLCVVLTRHLDFDRAVELRDEVRKGFLASTLAPSDAVAIKFAVSEGKLRLKQLKDMLGLMCR